ncbi:glycosyltransferase family 4 protein [Marinomonas pontica]|uniref:glycosyltransferase family 4 protein n=1 Tax=Marinomonas pontica TaxID=264739 RepID=UPI0022446670|nr:glycosyltransferase family 1 protein [Marinomonas pontica]MCW8354474.1 glycosyltransferase family 4 protein [Marinomonas pontica]
MKIFFDARWLKSGGIGRFCQEVMESNSFNDMEIIKGGLAEALTLRDIFSLTKITLLGSFFITPGYNAPIFGGKRCILTIHDLMHIKLAEYSGFKNLIYYNFIVKRVLKKTPLVFTVSEFTRGEICKWANIESDKVFVVGNGIDHDFFNENVLSITRERPYFFYVGNNKTHKNLDRLIRAFSNSKLDQHVDLLLSCSSTPELERVVDKLNLSKSIIFLSGIEESELPSYYKGALATLMVTLYEGFGLPILESMAVGTPVITSNITAMPEIAGGCFTG